MLRNYSNTLPIVCVSFILCLINIQSGHSWGGDFSLYLAQAKSILTGSTHELYLMNKFSMDHSELPLGPYLYPMGYPAILAPAYCFFGLNFIALKVYNLLFFIGTIPLVYSILRSIGPNRRIAFFSSFLYAINYQLIYFSDRLGSEFAFMFFSFLALHLMLKNRKSKNSFLAVGIGLSIFAAFSIRVSGMVLLPTLASIHLLSSLKEKRVSLKNVSLPYLSFGICWLLYTQYFDSMDDRYMEVFEVTADSLWFTITGFGERIVEFVLCLKYFPNFVKAGIAVAFYALAFGGMKVFLKRDNLLLFAFCGMTLGLHLIVPFCDIRYLFVISPFIIYCFLNGLIEVGQKMISRPKLDIVKVLTYSVLFVAFAQSFMTISVQAINGTNRVLDDEMKQIYAYINTHVPDEEVIVFHKPRVLRLFTNNNSIFVQDYKSQNLEIANLLLIEKSEEAIPDFQVLEEWDSFKLMERKD